MVFLKLNNSVVKKESICWIDYTRIEELELIVWFGHDDGFNHRLCSDTCSGFFAIELIWTLKPGAFEGKRLKWKKRAWAFHNLVAHPVMQLLAFVGLYKQAMWVHDRTIPKPIGKHGQE